MITLFFLSLAAGGLLCLAACGGAKPVTVAKGLVALLLGLPVLLLLPGWETTVGEFGSALTASSPKQDPLLHQLFLLVWGGGSVVLFARLALDLWAMNRMLLGCETFPAELFPQKFRQDFDRVLRGPAGSGPCVAGCWNPVLLLPPEAVEWEERTWRCVLLHERQHSRNRDVFFTIALRLVRSLYWFNPFLWWAEHRLLRQLEYRADQAVLQGGFAVRDYVEVMCRLAGGRPNTGLQTAFSTPNSLQDRVKKMLMGSRRGAVLGWVSLVVAVGGGFAIVGLSQLRPGKSGSAMPAAPDVWDAAEIEQRWQAQAFPGG